MPRGCLVKPVATRRDFLGSGGFFPIGALLLQPGLFLSASRALVWEDRFIHPKVWESLGWLQDPDIEHRRAGLCQKCVNRDGPIVWRPSFQRKGPKEPDATANIQRADGLPKNPNLGPSD